MESRSKAKIVASPKIITQNKKKAVISSTDSKSFSVVTVSENNKETRDYKESKATLSLEVLPQVTNEGSISMEISIKMSTLQEINLKHHKRKREILVQMF